MNNLKRRIKSSKSSFQKKKESIKVEVKLFRQIKQNLNEVNNNKSNYAKIHQSPPNINKEYLKNSQNLSTLLSPSN